MIGKIRYSIQGRFLAKYYDVITGNPYKSEWTRLKKEILFRLDNIAFFSYICNVNSGLLSIQLPH